MENWNRNEWQGRRRNQVESTNVITYTVIIGIAITLFCYTVKWLIGFFN
jgi:uncharacterized membrane protein YidH (DUF202 family)